MTLFAQIAQSASTRNKNQTMPDLKEFMTTDEAAKALGFTVDSVRNLVYKKKLESTRFGCIRTDVHHLRTQTFLEIFEP
jgi:excisionase family DNA binding protein